MKEQKGRIHEAKVTRFGVSSNRDLLRRDIQAVKKPFFRPSSFYFSPNMPDFGCKICLDGRKKWQFSLLKASRCNKSRIYIWAS